MGFFGTKSWQMIPFNLFCKNLVTLLVIILCNEEKK